MYKPKLKLKHPDLELDQDNESTHLLVEMEMDCGMLINVPSDQSGKLRNWLMDILWIEIGRKKEMIGLERGGGRVIGNYGMKREFRWPFSIVTCPVIFSCFGFYMLEGLIRHRRRME